jgi:hypothetical protein
VNVTEPVGFVVPVTLGVTVAVYITEPLTVEGDGLPDTVVVVGVVLTT